MAQLYDQGICRIEKNVAKIVQNFSTYTYLGNQTYKL